MTQLREEDHFENSSDARSLSSSAEPSTGFNGRKPWGLDAKGAHLEDDPWAFDHGIRRSPAEKPGFEGEDVRRSPAEELVSKGYFLPYTRRDDAPGEEFRQGDYRYRRRAGDGTVRLVAYEGREACVDIPAAIEGSPVTSLATNLFRDHDELQSVSMPDSIEYAGNHVFDGCVNLRRVRLSAALAQVDPTMFLQCGSLEEVTLSTPVVRLEGNSFSDAPVACVNFGPLVEAVDARPLGLPNLDRVTVDPENARFVTDGKALLSADRTHLYRLVVPCASYEVPAGCVAIDERAFDSLTMLEDVDLPDSLRNIGRMAFAKTGLSSMRLPDSVEFVGEKAFYHCAKLERVQLPRCLREIGPEAFAFSAVRRVELPAALERLGFRAFDHTPAQARIGDGGLSVASANRHLELDAEGGLYRHDVFVELVGRATSYRVRRGTHAVGDEAFKRHASVRVVELPEGVFSVGREAFRGNRQLVRVDLPESLERIGERAFLDTSLETLRLSKNVRFIGEDALLVQGDNQLMPRTPLRSISLDADNPAFYLENGLLCQRDGSKMGGDTCLLYVGPDDVVRIPRQVTHVASLAFCGAPGVNELYVHGHLHSICNGAFSTARTIPLVHVEFPEPVDGYGEGDFRVPELSSRYRSPSYLFDAGPAGTAFDFEYYDSWVTHAATMREFAPAALYRLTHPMRLDERTRELYEGIFQRKSAAACRYFAEQGDLDALAWLVDRGLLDGSTVEAELSTTSREGRTQATACLLELQHRTMPSAGVDFSL
ncbi:leucine-rich repeat domain-containing protein [Gordonibacter sp. 28C]|uniref:leucine-rich repeat domain-containing protein n=1 Tax=Gordonibacter sp. 28C TaxID=2078569 RepID=UPI001314256A|nr:leucine-rich repeat domain-containing protein [Gordonibacter sp. 28C]